MPKTSYQFNPFGRSQNSLLLLGIVGIAAVGGIAGVITFIQSGRSTGARQAIIQVTANGFVPATIAVKAGTEIVWKNADSAPHSVASNPYPQNSSVPGLSSRTILPNGSYTYQAASKGLIEYHDNTQPTLSGTIKVEQ